MTRPSGARCSSVGSISRLPDAIGHLENVAEPVRRRLVGAEEAEGLRVPLDDVAEERPEHARRLARASSPGFGHVDGVVAEVGQHEVAQEHAAVRVRVRAHAAVALGRQRGELGHGAARRRRTAPPAGSCAATPRAGRGARRSRAPRRAAPGASARCPRRACRRPPSARSSPWASGGRSSATACARRRRSSRAARWISAIRSSAVVERRGEAAVQLHADPRPSKPPVTRSGS